MPGEDLWMYEYLVSGFTFGGDKGFSVYFDASLFTNLQNPPPAVSTDWDAIAVQPDLALPSDGFFDALALVSGASLAQPFSVTFTWLGGSGGPGSQAFSVNAFDAFGNISFLEVGQTTRLPTSVPEPATLVLLGMGLLVANRLRRPHA